jgi:peptidoglycan/LPS O-acetylase OafA/YrhL
VGRRGAGRAVVVAPHPPRPRTDRRRRYRRPGWALAAAGGLGWAGFIALGPAANPWAFYPAFAVAVALLAAVLFAGSVCTTERKAARARATAPAADRDG